MHLDLTAAQAAVAAEIEAFAQAHVAPEAAHIDESGAFPIDLIRQAASLGYLGMRAPQAMGGRGLDHVSYALGIEAVARASATMAVILAVHNSLVCDTLASAGSAAQQSAWLPRLVTGEVIGAFALSEADAGTDAANQQTSAIRTPDGYSLTGRKVWVANGEVAGLAIVFAATTPGARGRGVSAFVVPLDRPGIGKAPGVDSLGVRGPWLCGTRPRRTWRSATTSVSARRIRASRSRDGRSRPGASPLRRRRSASGRRRSTRRSRTHGRARRSAVPSRSIRRFSGSWRTWRPNWRRRGC